MAEGTATRPHEAASRNGEAPRGGFTKAQHYAMDRIFNRCPSAIATYCGLLRYANSVRQAFPSINKLAEYCRRSKRLVLMDLEALEEAGLVVVERSHNGTRGRPGNVYTLPLLESGETREPKPPVAGETREPKSGNKVLSVRDFGFTAEPEQEVLNKKDLSFIFIEFWKSYPPKKRFRRDEACKQFMAAVDRIASHMKYTPEQAASWLVQAAKVFARSPKAQHELCPRPGVWLKKRWYEDSPATWGVDTRWVDRPVFRGPDQGESDIEWEEIPGPPLDSTGCRYNGETGKWYRKVVAEA